MEWQTVILILVAIVGSHAGPVTKPLESISSDSLTAEADTVSGTAKNIISDHSSGLKADCEGICQLCNATAKLEKDGSCTCLSDNGGEVECAHFPRYKKELKQPSEGPGTETERGERCLGVLGSSKDTSPAPAEALQSLLGDGLLNMSPVDRAEELRRRVDAFRAITITNMQKALERSALKIEPPKIPALAIPTLPKATSLAVSPFIGKSNEEVLGKTKEEETVLAKEDKIPQTQKSVDEPKLEVPSTATVNFNTPDFTFRSQIPSIQSGSTIYTPSGQVNLRIPQMKPNFLPQQLRMQPTNFGGFGNYRREGRALRSSGPFVIVQSPIIPNPSTVYDSLQSSSTDTVPTVSQEPLSPVNSDHDLPEIKTPTSGNGSSTFNPSDFTHSISKVAGGDLTGIGKLVDLTGAEKGVGSLVQGLIKVPKEDRVRVEVQPKSIESN